jgi:glucose-6-phosphate isomerase
MGGSFVPQDSGHAIRIDFNNALSTTVREHGLEPKVISKWQGRVDEIHAELEKDFNRGELAFRLLPHQKQTVTRVREVAARLRGKIDDFVVLGIGGSALGGIALQAALRPRFYNDVPKADRDGNPRIWIEDNIDPERFGALLGRVDPAKTAFNVISKSGETAETMAQFLIVREMLQKTLKSKSVEHIVVTTDPESGYMRDIIAEDGYPLVLDIPRGVGGRFSVLSPVGLLSAEMAGIDTAKLLAGAAAMDRRCKESGLWKNPAYLSALVHYLADTQRGKHISVMWAYSDALARVADWYCQLWAESLGKFTDPKAKTGSVGQTPLKAIGATDQHSMLQLFMQGPNDKIFTFISVGSYRKTVPIPKAFPELLGAGYLGGQTLNDLIQAERRGVTLALAEAQRPSITIFLPEIDEHTVGQLLFMLELQTAVAGQLYGVNAFDQPGVQTGKDLTYAQMGRRDKAALRAEVTRKLRADKHYVL